jgi:hypothetical protein
MFNTAHTTIKAIINNTLAICATDVAIIAIVDTVSEGGYVRGKNHGRKSHNNPKDEI